MLTAVATLIIATQAHDYLAQMRFEEQNLNNAWVALAPWQQDTFRKEERQWIIWKDALGFQEKMQVVRDRASYLWHLSGHTSCGQPLNK